jgi:hypothetical protein
MGEFPNPEPKRIKVFGVLHLVFAGLGLLGLVMALVMPLLMKTLLGLVGSGPGGLDRYTEINLELTAMLTAPTSLAGALTIVLGLVMVPILFLAGLGLVKRRRQGLIWSNRYCWLALGLIVVNLVLFFALRKPMIEEFLEPYLAEGDAVLNAQLEALKVSQVVSGVLSPFLSAIYPIIALIMLNKPIVKNYFDGQEQ